MPVREGGHVAMPRVPPEEQSTQERIGKETPQGYRFGVP
jgi:hypothetical protein